ncbi:hypothetical protein DBR39_13220 [Chryseobacterium sp. KBW03]|uniref:hypothetical protein n=1 Tax=Chryseobacterium sp. KBW03 TaxID=2153362 RepID=UPI000F59B752|nr:hypothetical protein [Chryseobacterium sp. KBW03]RQO37844.1 hypothetical protein DBR39_13220 [Chryseobacterium sp. KBW03]
MTEELDSFYLELIVMASQTSQNDVYMEGQLEITLNNKKPYAEEDIIDIGEFYESIDSDGEFKIFSCCCGIPECSGWLRGIQVDHIENKYIKWTNLNTGQSWTFEKHLLVDALQKIDEEVEDFKKFFSQKDIRYVGYGY